MKTAQTPRIDTKKELLKCRMSCAYFINEYVKIYDALAENWIPFKLWPAQFKVLETLLSERLIIILKARQLGLTWLVLGYILWLMLFNPVVTAMLFSRRDTEAMYILGDERLLGMYKKLPDWMQFKGEFLANSAHNWILQNDSNAKAFPTSAGDSYTASIVFVDEADLAPDLNKLMRQVKPTIDAGGQMILLSRADKDKPASEFKKIYQAAKAGINGWSCIFLPWDTHPDRDQTWYQAQTDDILSRTDSHDDLHEQYPATDEESLAPKTKSKRIPSTWIRRCYIEHRPLVVGEKGQELPEGCPAIPGLRIHALPEKDQTYKIGIDPAEGNPTSNDSALVVLNEETGEEAASYRGKIQPAGIANYADQVGQFYNEADILPERNNHGHAVILWLDTNSKLTIINGSDGKPGWLSNNLGKTRLYDDATEAFKDGETILHSFDILTQLQSIDGSTFKAPEGEPDDLADSYALALVARRLKSKWRSIKFLKVGGDAGP
jgi:hypothetical protein